MAHRHVMDKDGNSKMIHSDHGDVPHAEAHEGHSSVKHSSHERNMPHGHNAHPNPMGEHDHDGDGQAE